MRMMRASVVSWAGRVVSTSTAPSWLIVPAKTSLPGDLSTGADSPVMGAWLTLVSPFVILPSSGNLSPGRATIVLPTGTSRTSTTSSLPSGRTIRAVCGLSDISVAIARRARPTLHDSNDSESANRKATVAASKNSSIARAPTTATVINKFMSGRSRNRARQPLGATYHAPATTALR